MDNLKRNVEIYFTVCYEPDVSVFNEVEKLGLDKYDVSSYAKYVKTVSENSKLVKDFAEVIEYFNQFKDSVNCEVSFNKLATEEPYFNKETETIEDIPLFNVSIKDARFGVNELVEHIGDSFERANKYFAEHDYSEYEEDKNISHITQSLALKLNYNITFNNVDTGTLMNEIEYRNFNMNEPNIKIKDIEDDVINSNITSLNNTLAQFDSDLELIVKVMSDDNLIDPDKSFYKSMINRVKNDYNKSAIYSLVVDIANLFHGTDKRPYYDVTYNDNSEITSICLVAVE